MPLWKWKEVQEMSRPVAVPPTFTTIDIKGIDDVSGGLKPGGYLNVYGVRKSDTASRLVGVSLSEKDATDFLQMAEFTGSFPQIEVQDRYWFYVCCLGPSHFEHDSVPS